MEVENLIETANRQLRSIATTTMPDPGECRDVLTQMAEMGYQANPSVAKSVIVYLSGLSLNLCGSFGGGKSAFWKVLSMVKRSRDGIVEHPNRFAVIRMPIVPSFSLADLRRFVKRHEDRDLVIDDLGSEAKIVDFGTRCEAVDLIMSMRESSAFRTHFTSNVGFDDLKTRYGNRIADRMSYATLINFKSGPTSRRGEGRFRVTLKSTDNYIVFDHTIEDDEREHALMRRSFMHMDFEDDPARGEMPRT